MLQRANTTLCVDLFYTVLFQHRRIAFSALQMLLFTAVGFLCPCGGKRPEVERQFRPNGKDNITGISIIDFTENTNTADAWYDLKGRRLSGQPIQKGIYIHQGKKIVVK